MRYTTLGATDLEVSKICLGTMTFGEQNSEADAHQQLDYALDQGINFIDTAELYSVPGRKETQGSTERFIGSWLKDRSDRDRLVVATKIAGPSPGLLYIRDPLSFSPSTISSALEGSLNRLQTDYVDLYQLHWPERNNNRFGKLGYTHQEDEEWNDNFLEVLNALNNHIKAGKICHWGLSNETPWGVMRFLQLADQNGLPRPVTIQNPYSLLNRTYEIGLAEISMRENIGLLSYSPLGFGMLTGKYHGGKDDKNSRMQLFPKLQRYASDRVKEITAMYLEIAEKNGLSPAQMALSFVNSRQFLCSNIIGATTMVQLEQNIGSINIELPEAVIKEIEGVHLMHSNPAP